MKINCNDSNMSTLSFNINLEDLEIDINKLCEKKYKSDKRMCISLNNNLYLFITKWLNTNKKIKSLFYKYSYIFKGNDKKPLFNTRSELVRFLIILDYLNRNNKSLFCSYKFLGQKRKINGKYYDFDSYYVDLNEAIKRKIELKNEKYTNACVLEAKNDIKETIYCVYKMKKYEVININNKKYIVKGKA